MRIFALVLIPFLALAQQYERPGSSAAQFLKLGPSPRGAAMGDAFFAVVKGAEATYYNPAALANFEGLALTATHNNWFADINYDFVAASYNFGMLGAFGLSITSLYTDQMKVTTPLQPEGTGETFYVSDFRIALSYARGLTDHVSFGGTISYVNMLLYDHFVENAYSADISAIYDTGFRGFKFGMMVANFGSSVTYVNEEYPLPVNFTVGMCMNAIQYEKHILLVSLNAVASNDVRTLAKAGAEWSYQGLLFIRAGYRHDHDIGAFSYGGGIRLQVRKHNLFFDYANSEYGLLGNAHRFGVNVIL